MMHTANLTLDSRVLPAQSLDIDRADLMTGMSGDGILTTWRERNTIVRWSEGSAREMERVSYVQVMTDGGTILLQGDVNLNFTAPTDLAGGGVEFEVSEGA